ncbi:MAG: CoB--CoM heterodisulfide reductase iron-sulfur subunit B family protein [Desulfoferrobacter sp.]
MKYFYYPGCSLEGTAQEYDASTQAVMRALGAELLQIEDWTCCGASAGDAVSYLLSMVLPARNLALAERTAIDADMLVPCSACYLNLKKVEDHTRRDDKLLETINQVLAEDGLSYHKGIKVRHLLDVLSRDIGADAVEARVVRELNGLRVAPYYGCQCLRPYAEFDDPQQPESMEPLIEALGAQVHPWEMGAKCCGAGLMTTKKAAALERVSELLQAAKGADCIATVCPMCQMNLESYQAKISRMNGQSLAVSILYLPQLMGLAFGLTEQNLKLNLNFAFASDLKSKLNAMSHAGDFQ